MLLKHSKKRSRKNSRKKYGQTRDQSSKEISKNFVKRREFIYTQQKTNETKSAFAERKIRSLKNIIYKYLEEKWTWTYIKDMPQFVNTINSRVNRVTQLAPNKVFKKHEPF